MKKSKTKLLFSILIIFTIIYTYYITSNKIIKTNYEEGNIVLKGYITKINIDVDKISLIIKAKEKLKATYYLKSENEITLKLGDYIEIEGTLEKPNKNTNFNLFNYRNYLLSQKIYFTLKINKINKLNNSNLIKYKIKNKINDRINNLKSSAYLKTFILGDNKELDNEALTSYQNIGVSHLLAISGMHITLLSSIILFILNKINKEKITNFIIVSLILIFYMFLTNYSPSVIRATLLFISLNIKKIFKLNIENYEILILILIGLLLYNPYYIYNTGFIFSFTISFFLTIFGSIANKYNKITKLFMTSVISTLASLPIMLSNYFSFNLLTPLINIIFIPLVSFIIFPLSLITLIMPICDNIFLFLVNIMEQLALFLNQIKIFNFSFAYLKYTYIIYYPIIIFILNKMKNKEFKYLIILVIILFIHYNINYTNTLTLLDVGQGDSILLNLNKSILIDTGGITSYNIEPWQKKNEYSISKSIIIPYMKSVGIKKLNYLIITHGDYDHIGEALNLIENFKVQNVILNNGEYNNLELNLIKELKNKKIPYYQNIKEIDQLKFLNTIDYGNENDNSIVTYIEINNYKLLLMGDASINTEKNILLKYNLNDIDILKVGHHGSKTSSSKTFINTTNPKYSLISVGKNNRFGHPKESVLEILSKSSIYRTDIDGSIRFKFNKKLKIETCL